MDKQIENNQQQAVQEALSVLILTKDFLCQEGAGDEVILSAEGLYTLLDWITKRLKTAG